MRSQPRTVAEGCLIQQRMLEHFNLLPPKMSSSETLKSFKQRRLPRKTEQALEVSEILFALLDDPIAHDIHRVEDAVNEIRYSMGFSWLAWMFAKYFITELIKWLWVEYHQEPNADPVSTTPVGTPPQTSAPAPCSTSKSPHCCKSQDCLNSELRWNADSKKD